MKNTTSLRTTAFAPYAITVLASLCPAQGSFTTFGQSCQEGLSLSVANTPRIGQTFLIRYLGIIGSAWIGNRSQIAQPLLLFGTSTTQSGTTPLPYLLPLWDRRRH